MFANGVDSSKAKFYEYEGKMLSTGQQLWGVLSSYLETWRSSILDNGKKNVQLLHKRRDICIDWKKN